MSVSKHIDIICVAAICLSLILTILFMNGSALGITVPDDGDSGNGQFTANDLRTDWAGENASRITLTGDGAQITGKGAYVLDSDVHILAGGSYIVSGSLTDGSLIIDADKNDKIWIRLEGTSIHCEDSAAILVEQAEKVFLTLADGTENTLSSGQEYAEDASSSGIDGTVYSRDDLTINGNGSLSVTGGCQHAIVCNDDLVIAGGILQISAPQDGIHANDSVRLTGMTMTINAGDDGITASNDDETSYIYMESGSVSIPSCYEGLEAVTITVAGGSLDISPTDDGINASGSQNRGGGASPAIYITGGDIRIVNPNGRDADGLDSNGDIHISGGRTFVSVSGSGGNCAIDCGTESGGVCEVSGGTVVAAGGSAMAEGFDSSSEQCFIMYSGASADEGTAVTLTGQDGSLILSETIPCGFTSILISSPELQMGETCALTIGETTEEITVDNSSAPAFGGFRGPGGGMPWGGRMQDGSAGGDGENEGNGMPWDGSPENRPVRGRRQQEIPEGETAGDETPGMNMPKKETTGSDMPGESKLNGGTPEEGAADNGVTGKSPAGGTTSEGTGNGTAGGGSGSGTTGEGAGSSTTGEGPGSGTTGESAGGTTTDESAGGTTTGEGPGNGTTAEGSGGRMGKVPQDGTFAPGNFPDNGMTGGRMAARDFGRGAQGQAAAETSTVSPETWILIGVSVIALLAGILIACKIRH